MISGFLFDVGMAMTVAFVCQLVLLALQLRSWRRWERARHVADDLSRRYSNALGFRNVKVTR